MKTGAVLAGLLALGVSGLVAAGQTASATASGPGSMPASQAANGAAADLRELAGKVVPALLQCNEMARSPYRVVVVMKEIANKTEDMPGRDLGIYVAKLTGLMNAAAGNVRVSFVEQKTALLVQETKKPDPIGTEGVPAGGSAIQPQMALYGTLNSMKKGENTNYLFQFRLVNLQTGAESWSGEFEVTSLR